MIIYYVPTRTRCDRCHANGSGLRVSGSSQVKEFESAF